MLAQPKLTGSRKGTGVPATILEPVLARGDIKLKLTPDEKTKGKGRVMSTAELEEAAKIEKTDNLEKAVHLPRESIGQHSVAKIGNPVRNIRSVIKRTIPEFDNEDDGTDDLSEESLQALVKILETTINSKKSMKAQDATQPTKPIEEVKFTHGNAFYLLPQLGNVKHPFRNEDIAVCSRAWLQTLDELLCVGWFLKGKGGLESFLEESARVVERDMNYYLLKTNENGEIEPEVKDGLSTLYNIIKFSMYFPDASRQIDRLRKAYDTLVRMIREQYGKGYNPFLPSNLKQLQDGTEKTACPPKSVSLVIDGQSYSDILRHWTAYDPKKPRYQVYGSNSLMETFECRPPEGIRFSWIPQSYRIDLEERLNAIQMYYTSPSIFKDYMYTLQKHEDRKESYRMWDENKKVPFILARDVNGSGFRVMRKVIDLNYDAYPMESGNEPSLRRWLFEDKIKFNIPKYYALLYVLLNVEAPPDTNNNVYAQYTYKLTYNGKTLRRMNSGAPVKAFQSQLLMQYGAEKDPGQTFFECMERFVQNVYDACVGSLLNLDLPDSPDEDYRKILEELFRYGGNEECVVVKRKMDIAPLNYEEVRGKTDETKQVLIDDFEAWLNAGSPVSAVTYA